MEDGRSVIIGDIHWVQAPAANGREQGGRRPAVILQDDQYAGGLPVVLRYGNDSPENGPLMTLAKNPVQWRHRYY